GTAQPCGVFTVRRSDRHRQGTDDDLSRSGDLPRRRDRWVPWLRPSREMPAVRPGDGAVLSDINGDRMLADLRALAAIGGLPDGGIDRLAWSDHDLAGRRWFAERMSEAGIEPRVDAALNVFGHIPGTTGPRLLTGSHLDSVPNGGRLDGAYGAVAALEVLRSLAESGDPLAQEVEIVGFADEEGVRFEVGLIGSLALVGELDVERLRDGLDWQGVPIRQVLATAGRDLD